MNKISLKKKRAIKKRKKKNQRLAGSSCLCWINALFKHTLEESGAKVFISEKGAPQTKLCVIT